MSLVSTMASWYKVTMAPEAPRTRLAIDLPGEVRRQIRMAAARRDLTLQAYVRRALDRQLAEDAADALRAVEDPVLADLWADPENAIYDDL